MKIHLLLWQFDSPFDLLVLPYHGDLPISLWHFDCTIFEGVNGPFDLE